MPTQPTDVMEKLFSKPPSEMSEREASLLLEQYKLYVELMDKVSERRHQANSFFLTVNTLLVTALTGFISLTQQPKTRYGWIIFAAIAGIVFCLTWCRLIQSYKQLNTGKFKIIHMLETRLPARLFDAEWDALNRGDGTVYKPFSHIEMLVPVVFALLYLVLIIVLVPEL
jgi:hypothetical protein